MLDRRPWYNSRRRHLEHAPQPGSLARTLDLQSGSLPARKHNEPRLPLLPSVFRRAPKLHGSEFRDESAENGDGEVFEEVHVYCWWVTAVRGLAQYEDKAWGAGVVSVSEWEKGSLNKVLINWLQMRTVLEMLDRIYEYGLGILVCPCIWVRERMCSSSTRDILVKMCSLFKE